MPDPQVLTADVQLLTADVALGARLLRAGGLVGFPTETVYGLGARAGDVQAVARVFAVKGRPADHPLIVHLPSAAGLDEWASRVPGYARRLAERLWPGPLTLVLPRTARAGDHVTGGQPTVGIRVPAHPVAARLLELVGDGVAAPSANRFGRVSPTTSGHVLDELGELLRPGRDAVLDGGPSLVGVESTIVDCTGPAPVVLRPGAVTAAQLAELGGVEPVARASGVRAPGTLPAHYAPRAGVELLPDVPEDQLPAVLRAAVRGHEPAAAGSPGSGGAAVRGAAPTVGLLALVGVGTPPGVVRLSAPADDAGYAQVLYSALREADALGLRHVLAVPPPPTGIGLAVRDRLQRAAHAHLTAPGSAADRWSAEG